MLRPMKRAALLVVGLGTASCQPTGIETLAPKDARFEVTCGTSCGKKGRDAALIIDVHFGQKYERRYAACCADREAVVARLVMVRDLWCAGLAMPPKTFGEMTIGVTQSELSGKRAATLEQGDGYVAFQCDDWLPRLIDQLNHARCCEAAPPSPAPPSPAPSADSPPSATTPTP